MTPQQYRDAIARLGFGQSGLSSDAGISAAGRFLCGNPRTSRRWASGESPIPKAVAMLLRLMVRMKLEPDDVK